MDSNAHNPKTRNAWNKGKYIGPKRALKEKEVWIIRYKLNENGRVRDLALFNLAIDSKLRGCDLLKLRMMDIMQGGQILPRATVEQQKTSMPVKFEITQKTRDALIDWIDLKKLTFDDYLFPGRSRTGTPKPLTTRQYARLVKEWATLIDAEPYEFGTHSLRRTKASKIYRETKNLRAVQILLGHKKIDSTVRYLGIDIDDALDISEHTDI